MSKIHSGKRTTRAASERGKNEVAKLFKECRRILREIHSNLYFAVTMFWNLNTDHMAWFHLLHVPGECKRKCRTTQRDPGPQGSFERSRVQIALTERLYLKAGQKQPSWAVLTAAVVSTWWAAERSWFMGHKAFVLHQGPGYWDVVTRNSLRCLKMSRGPT